MERDPSAPEKLTEMPVEPPKRPHPGPFLRELQIDVYRAVSNGGTCYFLVSAQESNQRKRPGEALTAKPFVTATETGFSTPTLSRPPPEPHPAPVDSWAEIGYVSDV